MKVTTFASFLSFVLMLTACSKSPLRTEPFPSPEYEEREMGKMATGFFADAFPFACSPVTGCEVVHAPRGPGEVEIAYLSSGEAALGVRLKMLREATTSIRIQALIFHGDESGLAIAGLLKRKKKQGLDVRVIVDGVSNLDWNAQWMYYDLQRHGIPVQGYEALGVQFWNELDADDHMYFNKRYHEKLFIVDGETSAGACVMGGLNIGNEYFGVHPDPAMKWRDQDILVRGPIVQDMVKTFDLNFDFLEARKPLPSTQAWDFWREIEVESTPIEFVKKKEIVREVLKVAKDYRNLEPKYHAATARFLHNRPRNKETFLLQAYLTMIRGAKHEILIENAYFIPSKPLREALIDAAARGVTVHIITNSKETNDLPLLTSAGRYYYLELMKGNDPEAEDPALRIYEWEGHHFGVGTVHSKFAVFDRHVAIVGSYNLDPRAERLNSETALAFESEHVVQRLTEDFYRDLKYSREITPAEAATYDDPPDILTKWEMDTAKIFEEQL